MNENERFKHLLEINSSSGQQDWAGREHFDLYRIHAHCTISPTVAHIKTFTHIYSSCRKKKTVLPDQVGCVLLTKTDTRDIQIICDDLSRGRYHWPIGSRSRLLTYQRVLSERFINKSLPPNHLYTRRAKIITWNACQLASLGVTHSFIPFKCRLLRVATACR